MLENEAHIDEDVKKIETNYEKQKKEFEKRELNFTEDLVGKFKEDLQEMCAKRRKLLNKKMEEMSEEKKQNLK
jgi:hypothetical protein